jgi:CRISPR-associated protein Csx10
MMHVVSYQLTLEEPALLTALAGEPNSSTSYDYVPGSVIRGLLVGRALQTGTTIDPTQEATKRRFFSAATRFQNAYVVEPATGLRSLPVPLSWGREKQAVPSGTHSRTVYDSAVQPISVQTKSVRGFVSIDGAQAAHLQISRRLNVHTERPRRGGGEGTVFRYDALESGQSFSGSILCASIEDARYFTRLLEADAIVMLGGARSAGYGRARLTVLPIQEQQQNPPKTPPPSGSFIITLLSDVIMTNPYGQADPTLTALLNALNRHGSQIPLSAVVTQFLDTTMVGGFNRKWGLPLPQVPALAMGSVIVLDQAVFPKAETLRRWLEHGIGERVEDGFGEVAVNWQQQAMYQLREVSTTLEPVTAKPLTGTAELLWSRIQSHQTEIQTTTAHAQLFTEKQYRLQGEIPRTQLARLRLVIADELRQPNPSRLVIERFLKDIQGKYADRQYQDSRIAGKPLKDWLRAQVNDSSESDAILLRRLDAIFERAQKDKKRSVNR